MLYIIGIGLNEKGISLEAEEIVKKADRVYLEDYTVEFPYKLENLKLGKKVIPINRDEVESNKLIEEAKKQDIVLLVYGSPLTATTHISLIQEAKKQKVKYKVIYSASVFDAVGETGLQLYKFGKITSIPNFNADSFIEIVKENKKINAHSLILVDIGLGFQEALERLENAVNKNNFKIDKLVVCSMLGTDNSKIYYNDISKLKKLNVKAPFCFIIPGKLHFLEEEFLKSLN
jgi:diphthine synthase